MKIMLKNLLTKSKFGQINIGTSRDEVQRLLGEPDDWQYNQSKKQSPIWKYGSLQLWFNDEFQVRLIGLYYRDLLFLPKHLNIEGYAPTLLTTLEEFKAFLHEENIKYQLHPQLTFDSQTCLIVGENTHIIFDNNKNQIDSIQCNK